MNDAIPKQIKSATNGNVTIQQFSEIESNLKAKIEQISLGEVDSIKIVYPHDVEALATVVKTAGRENWQIIPCGNGSKLDWGGLSKKVNLIVSTQKCDRLIEHAVDDLTLTVEAGAKLGDLQSKLKQSNQFLPIDPAFPQSATIGGIIATADTGSWRQRYGGIRDLVLGISFVRGDGEIAKAGGRVVKNVAGYDLMKLFIGSYGTLGIISQVTLRTYPIPATSETVVITGEADEIDRGIRLLKNSGLTPTAFDLITSPVAKSLDLKNKIALLVRFQTIPESIQAQIAQLKTMLRDLALDISIFQEAAEIDLWDRARNLIRVPQNSTAIISKIGILPTVGVELLQTLLTSDSSHYGIIHLGSGLGILQSHISQLQEMETIRKFCQDNGGFLSLITASPEVKQQLDVWGYRGNGLEMMKTIKQKFDPQQILNSDRFIV